MNNKMKIWISAIMLAAISFTACKKEESSINNSASDIQPQEITVMAGQADESFANAEVYGGTETEAFYVNENALPEAYLITESDIDALSSNKRELNARRIIGCMSQLQLSEQQTAQLRKAFRDYEDCKSSIVSRYGNALKELIAKYESAREELVKALRNGRITKQEFERKMAALRVNLVRERNALAQKARHALKECYSGFLRNLNSIMTERQWKIFVNCYR